MILIGSIISPVDWFPEGESEATVARVIRGFRKGAVFCLTDEQIGDLNRQDPKHPFADALRQEIEFSTIKISESDLNLLDYKIDEKGISGINFNSLSFPLIRKTVRNIYKDWFLRYASLVSHISIIDPYAFQNLESSESGASRLMRVMANPDHSGEFRHLEAIEVLSCFRSSNARTNKKDPVICCQGKTCVENSTKLCTSCQESIKRVVNQAWETRIARRQSTTSIRRFATVIPGQHFRAIIFSSRSPFSGDDFVHMGVVFSGGMETFQCTGGNRHTSIKDCSCTSWDPITASLGLQDSSEILQWLWDNDKVLNLE
jgi:hypothetical protein